MLLTQDQIKPKSFELFVLYLVFLSFLPWVDASHVYARAWALPQSY